MDDEKNKIKKSDKFYEEHNLRRHMESKREME